jgi:hypothetical protein
MPSSLELSIAEQPVRALAGPRGTGNLHGSVDWFLRSMTATVNYAHDLTLA